MPTILITDPGQRAALAASRSLGCLGWRVHTIGVSRGLAGASRHVHKHHHATAADIEDATRYRAVIRRVVQSEAIDVVIPVTDTASRALLGHDVTVGAAVAGPSATAYADASDKAGVLRLAVQCGLQVPSQYTLQSPEEVAMLPAISTATVIKPARSVVEIHGKAVQTAVRFVPRGADLAALLAQFPIEAYPLLVQERTIGDGIGVFLLRTNGHTMLRFAHRRLREKPPAGGVSTYRESITPPPVLVSRCEQLLDALEYHGAAMLEFKQDETTGAYVLMEINARLWGSVQLAIDAGVNFPRALVEVTLGMPVTPSTGDGVGVRSVWELGEVDHALALVRQSREQLQLPEAEAIGTWAALRALADHRWSDRLEVFRWRDPAPFGVELVRWLRGR